MASTRRRRPHLLLRAGPPAPRCRLAAGFSARSGLPTPGDGRGRRGFLARKIENAKIRRHQRTDAHRAQARVEVAAKVRETNRGAIFVSMVSTACSTRTIYLKTAGIRPSAASSSCRSWSSFKGCLKPRTSPRFPAPPRESGHPGRISKKSPCSSRSVRIARAPGIRPPRKKRDTLPGRSRRGEPGLQALVPPLPHSAGLRGAFLHRAARQSIGGYRRFGRARRAPHHLCGPRIS